MERIIIHNLHRDGPPFVRFMLSAINLMNSFSKRLCSSSIQRISFASRGQPTVVPYLRRIYFEWFSVAHRDKILISVSFILPHELLCVAITRRRWPWQRQKHTHFEMAANSQKRKAKRRHRATTVQHVLQFKYFCLSPKH